MIATLLTSSFLVIQTINSRFKGTDAPQIHAHQTKMENMDGK